MLAAKKRRAVRQSGLPLSIPSNHTTALYTPSGGIPESTDIVTPKNISSTRIPAIQTSVGQRIGNMTHRRTTKPTSGSAIYSTVRGRPPGEIPAGTSSSTPTQVQQHPQNQKNHLSRRPSYRRYYYNYSLCSAMALILKTNSNAK